MPADVPTINLLGQEDLAHTPQGRIISWALSYGRYIMIGTEIVVLLAFISRFSLDRKLTDLKEEIDQKQAILTANASLEQNIRGVGDQIAKIKAIMANQAKPANTFSLVATLLPNDTYLNSLEITPDKFSAEVVSATTDGFGQFLTNLQSIKQITRVEVGEIKKNPLTGLEFKLTAYE
ncbi:PilN domain-containing protein [Candidatus Gottesmanbacteria bacterium]|nr:PilN domain-containing protein [Candidatus Gottesmanbacteria bacterium]